MKFSTPIVPILIRSRQRRRARHTLKYAERSLRRAAGDPRKLSIARARMDWATATLVSERLDDAMSR